MPAVVAQWVVTLAATYVALGLLFAAPFLIRGVGKVDPHAVNAGVTVRLILLPGTVVLWPLLLKRWVRAEPVPMEHTAHRDGVPGARPR